MISRRCLRCLPFLAVALANATLCADGLEPFTPPPLAELDAKANWIDQPVVDSLDLRRKKEASEKPLATIAEALKLRNTSADANAKILSALGRLPADDKQINFNATIVRRIRGDVKSTNPIFQNSVGEFDVASLIAFNLIGFDWTMQPFALADHVKSWQSSKDGLLDKVVLRDDLVWSDGQPITAHDVAFTFQTIMDERVPVPAVRSSTEKLRWVHAYDDHTIVFFHKKSLATNVWNIEFPIIPKHAYAPHLNDDPTLQNHQHYVKLEANPITGGAYTLKSRVPGSELVFERRANYFFHQGKQVRRLEHFQEQRLKVITDANTALLALRAGVVEDCEMDPEQWVGNQTNNEDYYTKNTKATGTEWVEFHFIWNTKKPWFTDKRVRWAMGLAFDHQEMHKKQLYGLYQPATGPFHSTSWMAPKKKIAAMKQDLDKAEALLDEAGWPDSDGDGIRDKTIGGKRVKFEFEMACANTVIATKICALLKESLDRIGVVCHVRPTEFTALSQLELEHKFDAAYGGWGTGTDPDLTENIFGTGQERNFGEYSNSEVDKLYEQGRGEFDKVKRAAIYAKIHELIYADQPYTWLYYRNSFYGFNRSLRGYMYSPRGPYHYNPGISGLWKEAMQ